MVESSNTASGVAATPTSATDQDQNDVIEPASDQIDFSSIVYEPPSPSVSPGAGSDKSGGVDSAPPSMFGEGRGDLSSNQQTRSGRRRSPRPHATSRHRPGGRSLQLSSGSSGISSPSYHSSENTRTITTPPDSHHYSLSSNQRPVYGPHLMSSQPSIGMNHTSPLYSYPQHYHPGVPDSNIHQQNLHGSYQHMMQPPSAAFQYPQHSSAGSTPIPPMYPHHQANASPPLNHFPASAAGQSAGQGSSYHGTGQFQPMHYPSPISPQYAYHPHSYPSSPVYPPYAQPPYGQHYAPPVQSDRSPGWWYFPAVASQHQYEGGQYPGQYSTPYTQGVGHHDTLASPTSPGAFGLYPMPPTRSAPPESSHPTSSSPRIAATNSLGTEVSGTPSNSRPPPSEKPLARRSYHPNPPPHRSEWVMWAGNVPSDATHDELWLFFNQPPDLSLKDSPFPGVLSIFLISRSCCAFVNFESEAQLQQTIVRFNGKALRPDDPRCPRLVCRVRRKDDDLKAGVGGQRGTGLHSRWVKEQRGKVDDSSRSSPSTPSSPPSDRFATGMLSMSLSSDEGGIKQHAGRYSSSSGSYASTNSSMLAHHFPQRYFILKSLTQYDLDLSVQKGLWATQKHNEGILDQAYRTSQEVFLIFSVNKSGEFYGYGRMAGPVRQGEHRVSWATRSADSPSSSRSSLSPTAGRGVIASPLNQDLSANPPRGSQLKGHGSAFFSPNSTRVVQESPLPLSSLESRDPDAEYRFHPPPTASAQGLPQSAPGEVGPLRSRVTPQIMKHSLDQQLLRRAPPAPLPQEPSSSSADFELDPTAPIRAMRSPTSSRGSDIQERSAGSKRSSLLQAVEEEEEKDEEAPGGGKGGGNEEREESWGESFKIEWLCTTKLPFHRTRYLRNPWNHDREVKVSRDGTELEPTVGKRLVEEWVHLSEVQPASTPVKAVGLSRRGAKQNDAAGVETPKNETGAGVGDVGETGVKRPS